jgi:hypothetical protein
MIDTVALCTLRALKHQNVEPVDNHISATNTRQRTFSSKAGSKSP